VLKGLVCGGPFSGFKKNDAIFSHLIMGGFFVAAVRKGLSGSIDKKHYHADHLLIGKVNF
jgi:hypothetical protein